MTHRLAAWTLMASLAAGGTAVTLDPQVTMFVTVVAPAAGPVTNLTAKDFVIAGGKATIANAVLATQPLSIALLVDISRQTAAAITPIDDLRAALAAFLQDVRAVDPNAQISLMKVGGAAVPAVGFDAPSATVDEAVGTIAPGPETSAVLIEAIDDASHALAKQPPPRRAIVSVDFATPDPIPKTAVNAMGKDVFESGASVWAVSVRGPVRQPFLREVTLDSIVKNNGGARITIIESTGLKAQLQSIANSLVSQYELTIAGTDPQHVRDLKISTTAGAKVMPSIFAR